jgi:beta-phosphoglucomutase-like phosphatase (HAD superfamily)
LGFLLRPRPSISPTECLVIEDTTAGIQAARQAGMRVLAVSQTASSDELAAADLIRPSLNVAELDEILRQLAKTE